MFIKRITKPGRKGDKIYVYYKERPCQKIKSSDPMTKINMLVAVIQWFVNYYFQVGLRTPINDF